ncbi:MAG: hypothetical protein JWL81_1687 [Verrucomicrobiales bacterium]|nr:hypothetical protein [Verrucomicrobiales bacterium]
MEYLPDFSKPSPSVPPPRQPADTRPRSAAIRGQKRAVLFSLLAAAAVASATEPWISVDDDTPLPDLPYQQTPDTPDAPGPPINYGQPLQAQAFGPTAPSMRQPAGALSGKIVFTNGGHGWTADPNTSSGWRLQRGLTSGINEDYGNSDQFNLFALHCFNAGAVVVPMRPIGHQTREVVMDQDSSGVTFTGVWSDSGDTVYYGSAGDVPYRFAAFAAAESATATYLPNIPAAGFYPVYTWVRHGDNRGDQLYRIRHTGGETRIRIPHHRVGNGWVFLGEYYFNAGSDAAAGSVVISNLRSTAQGTVVVADAIRFGNGMGSVDRGNGVSGYPREDESCRYWVQAGLGQGQSNTLYNTSGTDEQDSWSVPGRLSTEMNRETNGTPFDRIHISFHSNAGGGRGVVALITGNPTANQNTLAQLCGQEVNNDLVTPGMPLEVPWNNRSTVTYTGGYTEISNGEFHDEMDATIIEVGFHDDDSDARLLRDPKVRLAIGKAAMHAVIRYMNSFAGSPLVFPPDPPSNLRASGNPGGSISLQWSPPAPTGGSGTTNGYVLYRSTDGKGFGNPVILGNITSYTLSGIAPGTSCFLRIAATNAGGESFPSEVAACRVPLPGQSTRVLLVNGYDRFDRFSNLLQTLVPKAWTPPGPSGTAERVLPQRTNAFDYLIPHGQAVGDAGFAYDSCTNDSVASGASTLTNYPIVIWASGQESTADESFSVQEQAKVSAFRAAGGHLMVSGSEIGWDLDRASGPIATDRTFYNTQLKADLGGDANDDANTYTLTALSGGIFNGRAAAAFDDGTLGGYRVQTPDILTPVGTGTAVALRYSGASTGPAAIQYDGSVGGGRVVTLGFPFESIGNATRRREFMADILTWFTTDADHADPDLDGFSNLLEYTVGSNPLVRDSASPLAVAADGLSPNASFHRNPAATDILTSLQISSAPESGWTSVATANGGEPFVILDPAWQVTQTGAPERPLVSIMPSGSTPLPAAGRLFFRLKSERW